MNGAESLLRSLVVSGVDVCFGNPGTSEMHFVSALDQVEDMRPVLGLQENVVTGAADGYARMSGKPACTLLHLGPGLANGLANLHNARRAASPIVNIVGDHAASHARYDAPLASDIVGFARPVSDWIHTSTSARTIGADAARAVHAANQLPGKIATLILPADTAWEAADAVAQALPKDVPLAVPYEIVDRVAALLRSASKPSLLLRGKALLDPALHIAGRIATSTGARLLSDTFAPRIQRGRGRVPVERLPYFGEQVVESLAGVDLLVLVGSNPPVSFFAYPDKPSWLTPEGCRIIVLSHPHEDGLEALDALADVLAPRDNNVLQTGAPMSSPIVAGQLDAETVMRTVARYLPEQAIVADESISSGFPHYELTANAAPHDYLNLTGGAIGSMMAVSTGAGIASPHRKVVTLVGDGSAMYSLQSLWTQARECLDVTTVIFANRGYKVLNNELRRVGAPIDGPRAASMLDLMNPSLDWVALAGGMGVEASRADNAAAFADQFSAAMNQCGPRLIEAIID